MREASLFENNKKVYTLTPLMQEGSDLLPRLLPADLEVVPQRRGGGGKL